MILRGVSFFSTLKYENLGKKETKFKNILNHWSVAEASLNDEKTTGRKSLWTVPLINNSYRYKLQELF